MKMEKVLRSALLLLLAAALCLSMAACTQTPAESSPVSETQTPETAASEKALPEDDMPEDAGTEETPASDALSSALPVKTLRAKRVDENPYMAKSDANIHHDGYNTDSTDEILPLGIYPEINVSYETTNANASPAIYFDSYGRTFLYFRKIAFRNVDHQFHRSDLFHYQHRVSTTIHITIIVITSRYHTIDGAE